MKVMINTVALGAVLAIVASAAAQEGVRQTERLIKRAEDTVKQIGETKAELQKTLDTYNMLVQGGSGDAKKLYNDLRKAADGCDKKRQEALGRHGAGGPYLFRGVDRQHRGHQQ